MEAQALIFADDPATLREWLGRALDGRVSVLPADSRDAAAFAEEIAATPGMGLVFVAFDDDSARERATVVERVLERHPDLPVVGVGERESSQSVLAAMRAGARDFLVAGRDDDNLDQLIDRILRASPRSSGKSSGGGRLHSVVSSPSSASVPFLAAHLASCLRARGGDEQRVILVDLSMPGGSSLVFLDTEQSYSALDALRDVNRCDQTLIETAFTRYSDGLYLLSLPEDAVGPPGIEPDDMGRLLDTFLDYFDHVVVAADSGIDVVGVAAVVARSHRCLLLSDQSVVRSRQNKHLIHALRQKDCPLDSMSLVIDSYRPYLGLESERLADLLDLPHMLNLTGRQRAQIEAMNAGELMFEHAPRDAYCREVEQLTDRLVGNAESATAQPGLLRRWFGR